MARHRRAMSAGIAGTDEARQKTTKDQIMAICIAVKYHGPTNTRGTRYTATMANWNGDKLRATVGYDYAKNIDDNQLAAVFAVLDKSRTAWDETDAWRRMMDDHGMRWRVKCAGEHPTTGEMIFGAALVDGNELEA